MGVEKNNLKFFFSAFGAGRFPLFSVQGVAYRWGVAYKWVASRKSQKVAYKWGVAYSDELLINRGFKAFSYCARTRQTAT